MQSRFVNKSTVERIVISGFRFRRYRLAADLLTKKSKHQRKTPHDVPYSLTDTFFTANAATAIGRICEIAEEEELWHSLYPEASLTKPHANDMFLILIELEGRGGESFEVQERWGGTLLVVAEYETSIFDDPWVLLQCSSIQIKKGKKRYLA
ncbi:hypothetical protein ACJX0J_020616 [Zea mays]